jgi:hypothetical protein
MQTVRAWVLVGVVALTACTNYRDQLERADGHFRDARYESALANLEDLRGDLDRFDEQERLRYEFVRGMTHARLGQREEARHWLALVRERLERNAGSLSEEAAALLTRTLAEVDTAPQAPATSADAGAPGR